MANPERSCQSRQLKYKLEKKNLINVIKLQENVRDFGQRIESFSVETFVDGQWKEIAASTTIGYRKMILLKEAIYTDLIRIHVLNSRTSVSLGNVSLYYLPPIQSEKIESDKRMPLTNSGWKTTIYNITSQSPISFLQTIIIVHITSVSLIIIHLELL